MPEFDDYYAARIPEPWTILGLRLRPFSLGHLILLHRIQSGFVTQCDITYEDLALSVLICAHPFEEARSFLFDEPDIEKFMKGWAKKLTGEGWLTWCKLKKLRVIPLAENIIAFSKYMESDYRNITFDIGEGGGNQLPLVQVVRVTLLRNFGGLTEQALMDRPWGLCVEDYITINALDGKTKVRDTAALDDALETAKKHYERAVANGLVKPSEN